MTAVRIDASDSLAVIAMDVVVALQNVVAYLPYDSSVQSSVIDFPFDGVMMEAPEVGHTLALAVAVATVYFSIGSINAGDYSFVENDIVALVQRSSLESARVLRRVNNLAHRGQSIVDVRAKN